MDVHRDGAGDHGRVDARHAALDHAVVRIHLGRLADDHVLGLRFGDLHFRLQLPGLGHLGQQRTGRHPLAGFDGHLLEDAGGAGLHPQRLHLLLL